jgi:hypothetical protein
MVIRVEMETWEISKGDIKSGAEKGRGRWSKRYGDYWVLWPICMLRCISLLKWKVLVSGISGVWGVYSWYSKPVSRW